MDQNAIYSFINEIGKFLHGSQLKSLARVVMAIVAVGQARTWPLASFISQQSHIGFKSALQAVGRLLGNRRLDFWHLGARLLQKITRQGDLVPLAVDWTEWQEPMRVLVGAAVIGKRAIPVAAEGFDRNNIPRSQNARENTFLCLLKRMADEAGRCLVILTDRGFRRVSWIQQLKALHMEFVVRLMTDVMVRRPGDDRGIRLRDIALKPGHMLELGPVALRQDQAVHIRVVGIWAKGQKEPWWLATSLTISMTQVASWYDRRMGVEEQLRDSKGSRYGVELIWNVFQQPERIGRFFILVGIAMTLWTMAGVQIAKHDPTARYSHKTKGPRRSLVSIGRQALSGVGYLTRQDVANNWLLLQSLPGIELRPIGRGLKKILPSVAWHRGEEKK